MNTIFPIMHLAVTDDCIYIAWQAMKSSKKNIAMTCLNKDLDIEWDSYTLSVQHPDSFGNHGILSLADNKVALSGWVANELHYYESNYIYAMIIENTTLETSENQIVDNGINCYPNPLSSTLHLEFSPDTKVESISVFDISGIIIKTQSTDFENIDISGFAPGVYVMKVTLENGKVFEEKIVKK